MFTSLPTEVLSGVCDALATPQLRQGREPEVAEGMTALLRLGQTCRFLREVVCPVLYRKVSTSWGGQSPRTLKLAPLVRTLAQSPALAHHVREVDVRDNEDSHGRQTLPERDLGPKVSENDLDYFNNLLSAHALHPTMGLEAALRQTSPRWSEYTGMLAILLLCVAPRVHTATFTMLNGWDMSFMRGGAEARADVGSSGDGEAPRPDVRFPNLRSFTLSKVGRKMYWLRSFWGFLAAAPNLVHLAVDQCMGGIPPGMVRLPRLKTVILTSTMLSKSDHLALIGCSTELERFTTKGLGGLSTRGFWQAFPGQVMQALSHAAASLRSIEIDLSSAHDTVWRVMLPEWDNTDPTISRAKFPALEELALNYTAVRADDDNSLVTLIAECPLLRRLVLWQIDREDFGEVASCTRRLALEMAAGRFKALKRVELRFRSLCTMVGSAEQTAVDDLERLFGRFDVEVVTTTRYHAPDENRRRGAIQIEPGAVVL